MNPERPHSSINVDLKDPIQIHLLTETALTDSKEYQILSQEEIDGLKKQCQNLTQRIDSTRSNLLIQSKYRDAAISMTKLYSPTRGGPNQADDDREAEMEREECERKCEELAAQLFYLEKSIMEPKRRLLEHTAGILQLTHKASRKKGTAPDGQPLNGVPGSPESMYTYTQSRNSLDGPDDFYTDDTSFSGFETLDSRGPRKNAIEIPMKSPGRGQKEDVDRLREENRLLIDSVTEMERKLEDLNGQLRESLVRLNPQREVDFDLPPDASRSREMALGDMLRHQVDYLEHGLVTVQNEQELSGGGARGAGFGVNTDKTLQELWDLIQSGYGSIKQQKDERRQARLEKGLEDDESDDEGGIDLTEDYTVINFASRVRWLYRQATMLKDQKSVLKRQIKQQRELNNKSDEEKDAELAQKQQELEQSRELVERAEKDAMDAQKMLSEALEDLEQARDSASSASGMQELRDTAEKKVEELQAKLKTKEKECDDLNVSCAELKTEVTIARAELDGAYGSRAERAADAAAVHNTSELDRLKDELTATAKELEDITKETLASEREKVDLESKLDEALAVKAESEAELKSVRERLDEEVQKARDRIAKLQDELDGERLKAGRGSGEASRPGAGASMLSEQFRATMREERKKFQEDIRVSEISYLSVGIFRQLTIIIGGTHSQPQAGGGAGSLETRSGSRQEPSQPKVTRHLSVPVLLLWVAHPLLDCQCYHA